MGTGNNTTCPPKVAVRIRDNIGKALDRVLDTWLALNMVAIIVITLYCNYLFTVNLLKNRHCILCIFIFSVPG